MMLSGCDSLYLSTPGAEVQIIAWRLFNAA